MRVVFARGAELERAFAFGVVRQWFESVLRNMPVDERELLLNGAAGLTRPLLLAGSLPSSRAADPVFSMLHRLFWLCVNLAERAPVVVVLDDAQWADPASLRFLSYLAGRCRLVHGAATMSTPTRVPVATALGQTRSRAVMRQRACLFVKESCGFETRRRARCLSAGRRRPILATLCRRSIRRLRAAVLTNAIVQPVKAGGADRAPTQVQVPPARTLTFTRER